ncbi:gephyrin-like molybdotransferase Glp [Candidatus Parabeggiatoa sp. HSG14]|uniref:molybdopterin molybdotransferase MoeA n=1 Tax=Candidatus Parabeggiatoa sp. HSG14 TaxID=3055593 RepID=UPI0025A72CFB|nr:molybdopterin molybdotransferase MoeA [Thiotrichales bacterium HSG14]
MKTSCCGDYDPNSLTVEEALHRIDQDLQPINGEEQLAIRTALGRVLAENVLSKINVPPHDNSAMDGYAVRGEDLPKEGSTTLTVIGTSLAGQPCTETIQTGQCARIFTGAVIPNGADTIIMQEHVERQDDVITIGVAHKTGDHVRLEGEDIAIGQIVLKVGKRLLPADIGLLASLGVPEVKVKRRLRVAFFSTGDELCAVGEILKPGQIYDSNRYALHGILTRLDVELIDMGVVRDTPEEVEEAFLSAAKCNDAIITSGGVSVGDADYVTDTLRRLGKVNFWKVAMKPGKPLTFGKIQNAVFFGLPGNPVSAMVTFYQFVQPALHRMMGQNKTTPTRFTVPCLSPLKKHPGRVEFQRGILETNEQGNLAVRSTGQQGSGILSSMSQANCFIILPRDCGFVTTGSEVLVEPFEGLI